MCVLVTLSTVLLADSNILCTHTSLLASRHFSLAISCGSPCSSGTVNDEHTWSE